MQNLLDSLPATCASSCRTCSTDKIGDPELQRRAVTSCAPNLEYLYPDARPAQPVPFRGDEEIDLNEAMQLMDQMQDMDELERQLERTQYGGDIDDIDERQAARAARRRGGRDARPAQAVPRDPRGGRLHPQQGQHLGADAARHAQDRPEGARRDLLAAQEGAVRQARGRATPGRGGERADDTKKYEFGDPFHLAPREDDHERAAARGRRTLPVQLHKDDFEVYRSEHADADRDRDDGRPVVVDGAARQFQAAKKVALALQQPDQQPVRARHLYIIGFSAYARELKAEQLPYVRWDESVLGTNMHHALMLAQNLLAKHKAGTRQIIMISDGEPTAHLERGRSLLRLPAEPDHDPRDAEGSEARARRRASRSTPSCWTATTT